MEPEKQLVRTWMIQIMVASVVLYGGAVYLLQAIDRLMERMNGFELMRVMKMCDSILLYGVLPFVVSGMLILLWVENAAEEEER
ncbi:hypothetical protein [Bacillus cereus]|uniref:Uncharacterized protein n=1 Tax=Bacillus cereus TaxID=1396 RepID=A0A9X7M243_BACCE|nr:hypothetical protein [Bacillus cereus]QDZ76618.1 hypothetical protein D0437_27645 [Bacillus cereus]